MKAYLGLRDSESSTHAGDATPARCSASPRDEHNFARVAASR